MATSHFSEKKWKYVSIGLMAVLALGFSFPQAFAHVTSDVRHNFQDLVNLVVGIDTKVSAIKAKTDTNLDATVSSRATQTSVDGLQGDVDALQTAVAAIGSGGADVNPTALLIALHCGQFLTAPLFAENCNLENAILPGANLDGARFEGANLRHAELLDSVLTNAQFPGADLSNANLGRANLSEASISNANLSNTNLQFANFSNASLSNSNLSNAFLTEANFDGARLTGVDFTGCVGDPVGTPAAGTLPDCA